LRVVGAAERFTFVGDVGGGRLIVGRSADGWGANGLTGRPRGVTGRRGRARKPIARARTVDVTVGARGMKKRWMMGLQEERPFQL